MAWLALSRYNSAIFHQVKREAEESGSHRAMAVIAGAFVEDHLTDLIKSRMIKDEKIHKEMFSPGRAFGDFGVKINLGYLMGLYSSAALKELDTIKYIRNSFAHRIDIHDFRQRNIRDKCNNLHLWQEIKIKMRRDPITKNLMITIGKDVDKDEQELPLVDLVMEQTPIDPSEIYLTSCRFYVAAFACLINDAKNYAKGIL